MASMTGRTLKLKMESYREEMLFHFKELLRINSVRGEAEAGKPFGGGNCEALRYMLRLSEEFGLKTVNLDHYIGYSEYGDGEEYICSIAHLDVVPAGEGWTYPPFGAHEADGIIYARGAGDDKPGNIAGLYALRCMKELGYVPGKKIRVIYGCAEETGMEDVDYYLTKEPLPFFGITPDSEGYDIVNAEKGRIEFRLDAVQKRNSPVLWAEGGTGSNVVASQVTALYDKAKISAKETEKFFHLAAHTEGITLCEEEVTVKAVFQGISAHAAMPEGGKNAISMYADFGGQVFGEKMDPVSGFIGKYIGFNYKGELLGIACHDDYMGDVTVSLGILHVDENIVQAVGDIRYPASVRGKEIIERMKQNIAGTGMKIEILSAVDGHKISRHKAFGVLADVCRDKGKKEPALLPIAGGTYAKKFAGRVIAFGGCGDGVHAPDEFVEINDFYDHADMISYTLYKLSKEL